MTGIPLARKPPPLLLFRYILVLLAGVALLRGFHHLGGLSSVDAFFYDQFFQMRGERPADSRIVVAAIDEKTLSGLGRWPLPRSRYAQLLRNIREADAVGMDIIMAEATPEDEILAAVIGEETHVVLPVYFDFQLRIVRPVPSLDRAAATGHVHLEQDRDGVTRSLFHAIANGGRRVPSFSSEVLRAAKSGVAGLEGKNGPTSVNDSPAASPSAAKKSLPQGSLRQHDFMRINYYGSGAVIPHLSFIDILEGHWPATYFKGKIVLVGVTAPGLEEGVLTPFRQERQKMAGVDVHGQILGNLLDGSAIIETGPAPLWLATVALALLSFLATARMGSISSSITGVFMTAAIILNAFILLAAGNIWLPPTSVSLAVVWGFFLGHLFYLEIMRNNLAQARKDWEEAFDAIGDGIVICDREGMVVRENLAARTMLDDRLRAVLHERAMKKDGSTFAVEEYFHEARKKYFSIHSQERFDKKALPCGSVTVIRDMTAQREGEENQRLLEEQFFQAQKMESIGRLAGGVAHDFNNILTAILGYGEMTLKQLPQNHKGQEFMRIVLEAGRKGAALTRQLLTFSRREKKERQVLRINSLIDNMARLMRHMIGENIRMDLRLEAENNVEVDAGQIEQVIMNLIINSRDAMPTGGELKIESADVTVSRENAARHGGLPPGEYVLLSVADTGHGIGQEDLTRIFDPFFSTKAEGKGTGLGLSIVWNIIKQHDGHVFVESDKGKGAVFKVLLPACDREKTKPACGAEHIPPKGTETVLLVEDQQEIRDLIVEFLSSLGYKVLAASNGNNALDVAARLPHPPDLLLTDVILPGISGVQLAAELGRRHPSLKVLFISGYPDEIVAEQGLLEQEVPFLAKPLTPGKLADKVRKVLDGKEILSANEKALPQG